MIQPKKKREFPQGKHSFRSTVMLLGILSFILLLALLPGFHAHATSPSVKAGNHSPEADAMVSSLKSDHLARAASSLRAHPHPRSVFGLSLGLLVPREAKQFLQAYNSIAPSFSKVDDSIYVYPDDYLHITLAGLLTFKAPLALKLAPSSGSEENARQLLRNLFLREWKTAMSGPLHAIGVAEVPFHTPSSLTTDSSLTPPADSDNDDSVRQGMISVTLGRPRLSSQAGIFIGEKTSNHVKRIREAIVLAKDIFFHSLKILKQQYPKEFELLGEFELKEGPCGFNVPNITHSTFLRFHKPPTIERPLLRERFKEESEKWTPHTVHFDRFVLFLEDRPYLHIPKTHQNIVGTYQFVDELAKQKPSTVK